MRREHSITVDRVKEVFNLSADGWVVYRAQIGKFSAGDMPKMRMSGCHFFTRLDGINLRVAVIAWVLHTGDYPKFRIRQKMPSVFDFNMSNLIGRGVR